jgi:Tol biopolymer transport system component
MQWYAWDIPSNTLQQITDTDGGHSSFLIISPDGQWVYYLDDTQGDEIGHFVRMPVGGGDLQDISPDLPPYSSFGLSISRSGSCIGFLAAYEDQFNIFCLDVEKDGTLSNFRKLYTSPCLLIGALLSYDGSLLTVMTNEHTGKPQFSLLTFDTRVGKKNSELCDGEQNSLELMVPSPIPGDQRLLASTTVTGIETLFIWDPSTRERTDLKFASVTGAVSAYDWSSNGKHILFETFNEAVQQLYLYNLSKDETIQLHYPGGINFSSYFAPNGYEIFTHWQNSNQPTRLIALSPLGDETWRTVISAGEVPSGHEMQSISFTSSDGQIIQGWLGVPGGDGPFQTVLETHGGPAGVASNNFSPNAQAWLDHGFAFLTINYRGSTTFGREFEQKIWGLPGHWELEDLVSARHWLVKQNIAKPDSILLTGRSYGGYLTLLALGKAPELWAGGMASVAIADWIMSYEDSAETLRGYQVALFGGTPEEKPEQYRLSSPITYAENVNAPVLIIQGRNDSRTPARPVEVYEAKMKSLGKDIEVNWYDTGHAGSFTSVEEGIRHQEIMLRFAFRVCGSYCSTSPNKSLNADSGNGPAAG